MGTFPTSTVAGESWVVSVAGMVDGVNFNVNDRVLALVDTASGTVYSGQWLILDYTDQVISVNGQQGVVSLAIEDILGFENVLTETDINTLLKLNTIIGDATLGDAADFATAAQGLLAATAVQPDGSVPITKAKFTSVEDPPHDPGTIHYDAREGGAFKAHVDEPDVALSLGEEQWKTVRNDTGLTIADGTPVYISGYAGGIAQITEAIADGELVIGLVTHSIETGTIGKVTISGRVSGPDFSLFAVNDLLYVSPTVVGELTNVKPLWPDQTISVGTVAINTASGAIDVTIEHFGTKGVVVKSYNFSSRNAASGTYYLGGFYYASSTDANLTQASPTQTHGTANSPYGAHAFIVFGAAATDGTTVTLTVSGTSFDEVTGVLLPGDSVVLYTGPAAGLTLNDYIETEKKWNGTATFTLTSDGVNFSMDFNYGYAKYDDFGDQDVVMRIGEIVGLADATDANFECELIRHTAAGWTYLASGFDDPGSAARYSMTTDYGANGIFNGEQFAWKRKDLIVPLDSSIHEGLILRVFTSVNNCIAYMNVHVGVVAV